MGSVPPIKIQAPKLVKIIHRPRLYRALDRARHARLTWVFGPAGSGKTTLVASYVRRRKAKTYWYRLDAGDADVASLFHYLREARGGGGAARLPVFTAGQLVDVGAFARRYFEAFFRGGPGALLVLDDHHQVEGSPPWDQLLTHLLLAVPRGARVVVTSRTPPPASVTRYALDGDLVSIDAAALALTREEAVALARVRASRATARVAPRDAVARLHSAVSGWMAGFVLLLESAPVKQAEVPPEPSRLFDYMAAEILSHMDRTTARLLVETAVLPVVPVATAVAATGIPAAGKILAKLYRHGLFVEEERNSESDAVYRYHPLFRSFLLHHAEETLPVPKLAELRGAGAAALFDRGFVDDALALYQQAGDAARIEAIVLGHALRLLEQGRVHTLGRWLSALPAARVEENGWLLYWRATAGFFSGEPHKARDFERAFDAFRKSGDQIGLCLAATGAIAANVAEGTTHHSLERWMAALDDLRPAYERMPPPVQLQVAIGMVSAMTFRRPQRAVERERWVAEATHLARAVPSPSQRRMALGQVLLFHAFSGEVALGDRVLAMLDGDSPTVSEPMTTMIIAFGRTTLRWMAGQPEAGLRASDEALAGDDNDAVRLWSGGLVTFGGMCAADLARWDSFDRYVAVAQRLARGGRPLDVGSYHFLTSYGAFVRGDLEQSHNALGAALAQSHLRDNPYMFAVDLIFEAGVLRDVGELAAARGKLAEEAELERDLDHPILTFWRLLTLASIELAAGQNVAARDALGVALPLGRKLGAFGTLVPRPAGLSALAAEALRAGIEPEYVTELIARRSLAATRECAGVSAWPWAVRVRVLGGLSLEIAGRKAATFGRSKMPPRLLAAIVGLSARGRSVAAERIAEALWPEADGDQGMHAFEVTLMRLRKALGTAGRNAVRLESGRVWLDEASCFSDVDALDALCATIAEQDKQDQKDLKRQDAGVLDALSSELLALYTGPLLADSELPPVLSACRERIRSRVAWAVRTLGERLRAANRVREAQRLHERALAADDRLRTHLASFNRASAETRLPSSD